MVNQRKWRTAKAQEAKNKKTIAAVAERWSDVVEHLGGLAGRPGDLQGGHAGCLTQAKVLLQRIAAETAAAADVTMHGQRLLRVGNDLDAGANRGSVRFLADELHG